MECLVESVSALQVEVMSRALTSRAWLQECIEKVEQRQAKCSAFWNGSPACKEMRWKLTMDDAGLQACKEQRGGALQAAVHLLNK